MTAAETSAAAGLDPVDTTVGADDGTGHANRSTAEVAVHLYVSAGAVAVSFHVDGTSPTDRDIAEAGRLVTVFTHWRDALAEQAQKATL